MNRIFKRSTAIILTAILTLSLSACSNQNAESDESSQNSTQSSVQQSSETSPTESSKSESSKSESSEQESSEQESSYTESSESESSTEESSETETVMPTEWQDNGIFSEYYDEAYDIVKEMTLDEKIGQMLFARCPSENAAEIAAEYHIGGYVLFGQDFKNKTTEEVIANITSYKYSQDIPMVIATDEEGGTVVRVSSNEQLADYKFSSPREIYANGGMDAIKSEEQKKAELLSSLLIDTNFAPVCDISVNSSDFMYDRSLGEDAQTTAEFVSEVTKISQSNGVSATLKHFPGYGNNVDTHTGIAIDERSYETFENNDFIPFKAGIDSGAHLVMVSHNIVNCMDSTKPASISANVHDILRNELGFTGIIVTDDLEMDAIKKYTGEYTPAVTAVLAGNDMLTVTNIENSVSEIRQAVNDGIIDESTIDHAVMRILAWKYSKGMI